MTDKSAAEEIVQSCKGGSSRGGAAAGAVLVAAGIVWLLSRLGYFEIPPFREIWPTILIALGFIKLFHTPVQPSRILLSVILMGVGGILLLGSLGAADIDIHMIWPFLVVLAGVMVIWTSLRHQKRIRTITVSENGIQKNIVFGGEETRFDTQQFEGGVISTVFGGAVIDLRSADIAEDTATLDISAVFGGVELRVPTHWRVVLNGTPVLGGYENKTRLRDGLEAHEIKTFVIRGNVVFGGVEIKN